VTLDHSLGPAGRTVTIAFCETNGRDGFFLDRQHGKTTVNWEQRTLRFLHLVLPTEKHRVFTLSFAHGSNGAQTENTNSANDDSSAGSFCGSQKELKFSGERTQIPCGIFAIVLLHDQAVSISPAIRSNRSLGRW
jgi:hypothetical protein